MEEPTVPQLWELASAAVDRDAYELAGEVEQAEAAGISLAARLAGSAGGPVRLRLAGGRSVAGILLAARSDGVVVADDEGRAIVPLTAVLTVEVSGIPATSVARLGIAADARELAGAAVLVSAVDGATVAGRLLAVGADHLVVERGATRVVVPLGAVSVLRRR